MEILTPLDVALYAREWLAYAEGRERAYGPRAIPGLAFDIAHRRMVTLAHSWPSTPTFAERKAAAWRASRWLREAEIQAEDAAKRGEAC